MEDMMKELELTPLQAVQLIKAMAEGLEKYLSSPISLVVKEPEPEPEVWGEDEWPEGQIYFYQPTTGVHLSSNGTIDEVCDETPKWIRHSIYFVSDVDPRF